MKRLVTAFIIVAVTSGAALSGCGITRMGNGTSRIGTAVNSVANKNQATAGPSGSPSGVSGANNAPMPSATSSRLVKQVYSLAQKGAAYGIPYRDRSTVDKVENAWGKAKATPAGAGLYISYGSHRAAFGFNKGDQIFDVRSYQPALQSLTLSDIERVLGKPGATRYTSDSYIYLYPAGPDYQLLWVFQKDKQGRAEAYLGHISVFWPQGTVNLMAQNTPAPSVVIDNSPGTVGRLFTFSLKNIPSGYHLAEFQWIPSGGHAVVNTFDQAVLNGRSIHVSAGFNVSPDGQTLSFIYRPAMIGQKGRVRLIFQATSGKAVLAQSAPLTLE